MKNILSIALFTALSSGLNAQSISLTHITDLSPTTSETSGLVYVNGELFTHNDSGGEPALYSIDIQNGNVLREVFVENATNVDWEDLAADDSYVYIGDFGNNNGDRKDLRIYKVAITDLIQSDTVQAQIIEFGYADQTDFTSNIFTNFDAEALIEFMGTLYIFTKNRADFNCNVYALPNVIDSFAIQKIGTIASSGLITAATRNSSGDELILLGLDFNGHFALHWQGALMPPFNSTFTRVTLTTTDPTQMEGICFEGNQLWVSTESRDGRPAALFNPSQGIGLSKDEILEVSLYPNPSQGLVFGIPDNVSSEGEVLIFDLAGKLIRKIPWRSQVNVDLNSMESGSYFLLGRNSNGNQWSSRIQILKP